MLPNTRRSHSNMDLFMCRIYTIILKYLSSTNPLFVDFSDNFPCQYLCPTLCDEIHILLQQIQSQKRVRLTFVFKFRVRNVQMVRRGVETILKIPTTDPRTYLWFEESTVNESKLKLQGTRQPLEDLRQSRVAVCLDPTGRVTGTINENEKEVDYSLTPGVCTLVLLCCYLKL